MTHVSNRPVQQFPHPRFRLPLLGDVLTINPAKPTQASMADARRYGPIFERLIVKYPIVVVSSPELISEINDEKHWTKNVGVLFKLMRPIARDGLFTAYNHEPNWSKAHNILSSAFTQEAMRRYHQAMTDTVFDLLDYWSARQDQWVDIADSTNRFTLEVIGRAGFSYSFDSFTRREEHPFVAAMTRGLRHINRNANLPPALHNFPRRRAEQHRRDIAYAHQLVDDVIAARRREDPDSTRDLLGLMLNHADPATGEKLDEINIRHQILTFLVAGHETSAGALAFALYFLANHPDVAAKARAEVDERWPGPGRADIEYPDVSKLRYLRRVLDETLRLWPIAPGYFREARHDTTIGDGRYTFEKGDWVFVLTLQAHRDPVWGPDHDEFDPDRFLPENLRKLDAYVYKPFGTGERACIGRQFAYHEILLSLAHIIHTFTLEPEPGYRLDVREQITLKPNGFRLKLHQRI
ncbi:unspecific monooxygenase [Nocardia amikacinitolerans]|uniref:Unspecific monooxygenase n=1 Tax=Nocardia amikacinitolerans TaxID=756689 RepID=A0A285LX44_9NOCA|nr:cytochrome P450 [Nocardia amikacinitolerans]MCP2298576.1 unspecific monooxygenase [Nocardia amikacinitolerans]SNY89468.1 unspecific monooxygenase [Nocardia amikacinitolerans]